MVGVLAVEPKVGNAPSLNQVPIIPLDRMRTVWERGLRRGVAGDDTDLRNPVVVDMSKAFFRFQNNPLDRLGIRDLSRTSLSSPLKKSLTAVVFYFRC